MVFTQKKTVVSAIHMFEFGDCRLNVVLWKKQYYFSVIISSPNEEVLHILHDVISSLPKHRNRNTWYLSQLEIALDVCPEDSSDVDIVKHHLVQGITIPKARGIVHRRSFDTDYFTSSDKKIAKAGKGIRSYVKNEDGLTFARLEVQLNSPALVSAGLRRSLLIDPAGINVFEYFQYRRCDARALEQAIQQKSSSRQVAVYRLGRILSPRAWSSDARLGDEASVAQQLEHFKKAPSRYAGRADKHQSRFFPISFKAVSLPIDLMNGFIRRMYRTRPPKGSEHKTNVA